MISLGGSGHPPIRYVAHTGTTPDPSAEILQDITEPFLSGIFERLAERSAAEHAERVAEPAAHFRESAPFLETVIQVLAELSKIQEAEFVDPQATGRAEDW